jgi:hypothetical protein
MKKNLLFKFVVLAAMALFTVTACQNDNVDGLQTDNDEIALREAIRQLDGLKVGLNDAITARIKAANKEFSALKQRFEANPGDEALQTEMIAKAVHIESLATFQTRATGTYPTAPTVPPTLGGNPNSDVDRADYNKIITYLNNLTTYLSELKTYIENNSGGGTTDLGPLTARVAALESAIGNLNALVLTFATKAELQSEVLTLNTAISNLSGELNAKINIINTLLGIAGDPPASSVLDGINAELTRLDLVKANKFTIEEKVYDLVDVYNELQDSLAVHRTEINDLKKRVTYIETVEIPAIWEGISFLYAYIGDVYDNFDHRVTGLTFKPDYDFGPGLSSLILVRGLSEWESKTVTGGFGWKQKAAGSVYKGITWLTYNVSPANAEIDIETLKLTYSTTKMITRSTQDPLLEIVTGDANYPVSFANGVLRVPVRIHQDAYPLVQTSFDPDAKENIKVALKLTNKGYTAGDEPTRPEEEELPAPTSMNGNGGEEDRSVVSSEYVTVWLGLFDGRIAEKDASKTNAIGLLFPTEIITADFLQKDCSNTDYPVVTLWVGEGKPNTVTIADSVLAVFNNLFEKEYSLPASYLFTEHTLGYELVNLGNSANGLVAFTASNGKIDVSTQNRAAATGKTLAVLVKANVNGKTHALGYVRVIIAGPEKELIAISPNLSLGSPVTINCSAPVEFTVRNTVSTFIINNIISKPDVNSKTNITTAAAFYQKYTGIEINSVAVTNSTAQLPALTENQLKAMVAFQYITTGSPYYIMGTISNEAPLGDYTVVTTLKSNEYIPDLQITWKFSVRVPQLMPSALLVNNQYMITLPAPSPNITASYTGTLNSAFLQQNGQFNYNYLNPSSTACPGFITPNFIFKETPAGYTISGDGRTLLKNGVEAAVIEEQNGVFTIRLIEGPAAYGLVGTDQVKVEAKGLINGGVYVTYPAFSVIFVPPLYFALPTTASFNNNQFAFNLYAVGYSGADIIRAWDGTGVPLKNNKEWAKLLIDYYGINYTYDETYSYGGNTLSSPLKLNLTNITYASGSSNTFGTPLASLGATVTVGQYYSTDVEQYYNILTPIRYRLTFNGNGATLPANLRVSIPITMEHRWGITEGNLIIRVN